MGWPIVTCILGLYLCHVVYVQASMQCAHTLDGWNRGSVSLQCQEPKHYHCLPDEFGHFIQKCSNRILVPPGMCPRFNSESGQINVFECQSNQNSCPPNPFWSYDVQVLIYYGCYIRINPTTTEIEITSITKLPSSPLITHMTSKDYDISTFSDNIYKKNPNSATTLALVIPIVLVMCVTILITGIIYHVRKRRHRGENGELENQSDNQTRQSLRVNEDREMSSRLLGIKCQEELRKLRLEDPRVYVASGPNLSRKAEQSDAPQILLLVQKNPLEKKQIDEHAKRVFGRKYVFCWKMSHYQQHKQEEQASMLVKDFDFKSASVEEILKKLLAVVAAVETRVAFVVAVPLETWSLNRENISQVEGGDKMFICKTEFV